MNGQCFLALRCFLKFRFSSRNSFNSWAGPEHRGQTQVFQPGALLQGRSVFICPLVLFLLHAGTASHPLSEVPTRSVALFSLAQPLPCHDFVPARDLPSASRGLQCPEGSQGIGEEALKAYCTRTLPSTHRSHADPTSLGGQENRKTHHLSNSRLSCLFNYSKNSKT